MVCNNKLSRRQFIKGVAVTSAGISYLGWNGFSHVYAAGDKSQVFKIDNCAVHDGQLRHLGVDRLLGLLSQYNIKFYKTTLSHPWGGTNGIIDKDDVVIIKMNCQWKCRGTTNTDVIRGLIYRILQHPDGFNGEVVIMENGQGQASFDGNPNAWGSYSDIPGVHINAEDETVLTVDYLVNTVFSGSPVSSFLLDNIRATFISDTEHSTNGYRKVSDYSYPCFTTTGGNRIELKDGIWNGATYDSNLKLINVPVLKHHDGTGITATLKHMYGILSMSDGSSGIRHYAQSGIQTGKIFTLVRTPDLNILDCIWTSFDQLRGYPPEATSRTNILLGGMDPVALDYYSSKHILYPLGGSYQYFHNPDVFSGLMTDLLTNAKDTINANGGIRGEPTRMGDANIEVITESASIDSWMKFG